MSAFRAALDRQQQLCPASCACARASMVSSHSGWPPNASSQCASAPRGLRSYLGGVYPVAFDRLVGISDGDIAAFFDSLHFYYDYGCPRAFASIEACFEPGVMLRWLYAGLLPCREVVDARGRPSYATCVRAHSHFDPAWARTAVADGFVEIEHRAVGFAVRTTGPQMAKLLSNGEPCNASAFMDAGAASMWYTVRKGSGIFYRLGRTKLAPGKTALVAELLDELSQRPALAAQWPALAQRANLFAASAPSSGASADAERIRAVANGSASCVDNKLQPCRCRYVLHDTWDDAMVWLARALGYETLFMTATLLCNQPMSGGVLGSGGGGSSRGFATAYPELVDVRPLDAAMVQAQARGVHKYLHEPAPSSSSDGAVSGSGSSSAGAAEHMTRPNELSTGLDVHTRRKRPEAADAWVRQMLDARLLTLRNPFDVGNEADAKPCVFSVRRWTLQCADHISSRWPASPWARCGIVGCGYTVSGGARRAAAGRTGRTSSSNVT